MTAKVIEKSPGNTLRGQLVSQMTRQPKLPLTALSANTFTPKVVDAQLEFPKDEQGPSSQLVLHQNGRDQKATRTK